MSNITFVKGNAVDALLNSEVDYLINQVNCQGKYASGIAREIGKKIPAAKEGYHHHVEEYGASVGEAIIVGKVIHLFGQEFYGRDGKRYTHYGHLANSLVEVRDYIDFGIYAPIIGVPDMIGCGLAGGDRGIVLELIEGLLHWAKEVRVYTL